MNNAAAPLVMSAGQRESLTVLARSSTTAHREVHLHFTPASSSWLDLVERWFRELTDKAIRRGVFDSVPDLIASIEKYMEVHNDEPKPLGWTATAESILTQFAAAESRWTKQSVNDERHH